jgi:pimeloyl-ACP methyl ester carboxylesterase
MRPSLVLTGENDGGCNPRLNKLIHEALPSSELVILPHVKHSILVEAADAVSDQPRSGSWQADAPATSSGFWSIIHLTAHGSVPDHGVRSAMKGCS